MPSEISTDSISSKLLSLKTVSMFPLIDAFVIGILCPDFPKAFTYPERFCVLSRIFEKLISIEFFFEVFISITSRMSPAGILKVFEPQSSASSFFEKPIGFPFHLILRLRFLSETLIPSIVKLKSSETSLLSFHVILTLLPEYSVLMIFFAFFNDTGMSVPMILQEKIHLNQGLGSIHEN